MTDVMQINKWRVYVGPVHVSELAEKLKGAGWDVTSIGTEHIQLKRANDGWGTIGIADALSRELEYYVDAERVEAVGVQR